MPDREHTQNVGQSAGRAPLKITALSIPDMAKVLSRVGGRPIAEETIRKDIEEGAPVNPDGTVNLIHYGAWLVGQATDYRPQATGGEKQS